ncbi:MAG: ATP-dependent helicase [Acidothermus sp.]|nr:ATP-dependent helicase [Acidothermus sp.]
MAEICEPSGGCELRSARELAAALGLPTPTPEQQAVIEARDRVSIVVAGAGSGKTETMAARVVFLVANGWVRPDQVLGLTFTRRAAAELAGRVRRRLAQLARRGLLDPAQLAGGEPTVMTYDAYAGRIVADHALRLGVEPGQRLISPAGSWQFARRAVDAYDGPMDAITLTPMSVTQRVYALAAELAQHRVDVDAVTAWCTQLADRLERLDPDPKGRATVRGKVDGVIAALRGRCQLLPIVEEYRRRKKAAEVLDFADQMALAADLAERFPEIGRAERATFRAVLLDEFQDTSHAQLEFLSALFSADGTDGAPGTPWMTVVGDPAQAIYGWRGASHDTFRGLDEAFRGAGRYALSVSFRNGPRILDVANELADALRRPGAESLSPPARFAVPTLSALPDAPEGEVRCGMFETVEQEAQAVADFVAELVRPKPGTQPPTAAILLRTWRQLPAVAAALRARDVPVRILGVGGLLVEPEIQDLVAVLRVLVDPQRGDALMRLLTGARWRIGPADLAALMRWARRCAAGAAAPRDAAVGGGGDIPVSLVDALDRLPGSGWCSPEGSRRLRALADELRWLRRRLDQPLPDLLHEVISVTGLDVEAIARDPARGRANLDAFVETAARFAEATDGPTLAAFLDYVDAGRHAERGFEQAETDEPSDLLTPVGEAGDATAGVVDILTVHSAKGLEWDVVCLPGWVDGVFPPRLRGVSGWLTAVQALPWPLRGDRAALPAFDFDGCAHQGELAERIGEFETQVREHRLVEERRLAYVAVTRARRRLLVTGYRWDDTAKPRPESVFLAEVRRVCARSGQPILTWVEPPPSNATNPRLAAGRRTAPWPADPAGARREALDRAAELVRQAIGGELTPPPGGDGDPVAGRWERDVDLLLAEMRDRTDRDGDAVPLPAQLSVSQLVELRGDPETFVVRLRRPVPLPPIPQARRGTAFHQWVEQRFRSPALLDIDELPGAFDAEAGVEGPGELEELQDAFLASPWAARTPVDVEVPFQLVVAGIVIRGRMDAVFQDPDGGYTIVDWKTGRRPADLTPAAVQLAAYRLAWSELTGCPLERVRAVFCYLRDGGDCAPSDLLDRAGIERLITGSAGVSAR